MKKQKSNLALKHISVSQRGITLIALVITIIVMLILVGVTINVALSGGLFNTAKTAKKNTATAKAKEQATSIIMGYYDSIEGKLKETTAGELLGELEAIEGVQAVTGSITEGYTVTMENEEAFTIGVNGTIANVSSYEDWDTWDGTTEIATEENGVYSIDTAEKLAWIAEQVNLQSSYKTFEGKTIRLDINIDLNNIEWVQIGFYSYDEERDVETHRYFKGTLDGNGKIIKNLKISETNEKTYEQTGLIGYCSGATVENITVQDASISSNSIRSGGIVGFVRLNAVTISGCTFAGTISNASTASGILAESSGSNVATISNCTNSGSISATNSASGITDTGNSVTNCTNTGAITANSAGGIATICPAGGIISNCTNTGTITANSAGGIVATRKVGSTIEGCTYSAGTPATEYSQLVN